jgi:hypothetical protein
MTTYKLHSEVGEDKKLHLEIPCDLVPGPVEVVVVVQPQPAELPAEPPRWDDLYGIARDVWQGIDALEYVRELRADRDWPQ